MAWCSTTAGGGRAARQLPADERKRAEVERRGGDVRGELAVRAAAGVDEAEVDGPGIVDHLQQAAVGRGERRAVDLVALDDAGEGAAGRVDVERAGGFDGGRGVGGVAVGGELVDEPDALLRERRRDRKSTRLNS